MTTFALQGKVKQSLTITVLKIAMNKGQFPGKFEKCDSKSNIRLGMTFTLDSLSLLIIFEITFKGKLVWLTSHNERECLLYIEYFKSK